MNYRPVNGNLIVKDLAKKEKTAGGIYLPNSGEETAGIIRGEVLAISEVDMNGKKIQLYVSVGDKVFYSSLGGAILEEGSGEKIKLISPLEVLAVETKE